MTRDGFYVQMHIHTSETSACGGASGRDIARACKQAGYDMIVVTDHFMNANIGCPARTPWKDKVEYLFRGYRAAKAEGDKIGLTVLKGWETFTNGPEYLTYGLDEAFLLENPDIADVDSAEYLTRVHAAGGFVAHAHPFRKRPYIPHFVPETALVDAFEVFNGAHDDPSFDAKALEVAKARDLIRIAGSDAHETAEVARGAMRFPRALSDMDELIAALRAREGEIVEEMKR
jgi:predicted metal-dependent phosphoesterase TrpH